MLFFPIIVSIFSLVFAHFLIKEVKKASSGSEKQIEIAQTVKERAIVFLKRRYLVIAILVFFLFFLLWLIFNLKIAFGFLVGVVASGLAGLISILVSAQTDLRAAEAAKTGLKSDFDLSFKSGSASGFFMTGLGLLIVCVFYLLTNDFLFLIAFCLGVSLIPILTRNLNADIFQTYLIALVGAMFLGNLIFPEKTIAVVLPLYLFSLALLTSIISTYFVKFFQNRLLLGLIIAVILSAIGFYPITSQTALVLNLSSINLYLTTIIGLLLLNGIILLRIKLAIWPVILIFLGALIGSILAGIYGLAIVLVTMISLTSLIIAMNFYNPIAANAAGISGMADLPESVQKNTSNLKLSGNTAKSATKDYAIASAGLAALVLFFAYTQQLPDLGENFKLALENPKILIGLFLGGIIARFFASLAISIGDKTSLKETILPIFLPLLLPVLIGFILGPEALGGFLIGSIVVGIFLATQMTTAINPMIKALTIVALLVIGFLI